MGYHGLQIGLLCENGHIRGASIAFAQQAAAAEIEAVGGKPPLRQPLGVVPD